MRLILVHGINNEENSVQQIEKDWMASLRTAWAAAGLAEPADLSVTTAYYADKLAQMSAKPANSMMMGMSEPVPMIEFQLLDEYRKAYGVTDAQIIEAATEQGVDLTTVPQGSAHQGWIIGIAQALEKILPTRGRYVIQLFLSQAAAYLQNAGVQSVIKGLVRKQIALDDRPTVIVSHSLGTLIAYELLLEQASKTRPVALMCTLGSPLPVQLVSDYVGRRPNMPTPPIAKWVNGAHPDDFVTMGRLLTEKYMGFKGIDNISDIPNADEDKHAISAYLSAPKIAKAIHTALTS